jgi:oxygen-independent coproporphyrinogen-3 oxidase
MWPYHPDLLARPVPRYTSYPTAVEFTDAVGEPALAGLLGAVGADEPVSLYVHIPFCREICWYCGCNTGRANRTQRLGAYLDALYAEIRTIAGDLGGRGRVDRIAFGGGSPNALSPLAFARLVDTLLVAFGSRKPLLSVEIDPRSFERGWALTLGAVGATRVSLGVQSFDPAIQAAIGRIQPSAMIVDTVKQLRDNGVSSLNFDLMYGLPGQDRTSLLATLEEAVVMRPERVALFGYAHVPDMLPRQKRIDGTRLPDQQERFAMAAIGHDYLLAAGYEPVGFDHFALPSDPMAEAAQTGLLRRNFQGFTDDEANVLIGIGASAISQSPSAIIQNEKNSGRYRMRAMAGRLTAERGVLRTADDQRRGRVIEQLLCGGAPDISDFLVDEVLGNQLAVFAGRGLAQLEQGLLSVTGNGLPYARTIAALFDGNRATSQKRFSSAI